MQHQFLLPTIIGSNAGHGNRAPVARQPSLKLSIYKPAKVAKMFVNSCFIFHLDFFAAGAESNWTSVFETDGEMLTQPGTDGVSVELQKKYTQTSVKRLDRHTSLGLNKGQRSQLPVHMIRHVNMLTTV